MAPSRNNGRACRLAGLSAALLLFAAGCRLAFVSLPESSPRTEAARDQVTDAVAASRRAQLLSVAGAALSTQAVESASAKDAPLVDPFDIEFEVNLGGDTQEKASFTVRLYPEWAPIGVLQMKELVARNWFDQAGIFRVVPNFICQFGLPAIPQRRLPNMRDDPVKVSNKRGTLTFATAGPNTRTSQLFFNFKDNAFLDRQGFAPIGEVIGDGMSVVDRVYAGYGERPQQGPLTVKGNEYLDAEFPKISKITKITFK
mmetsp:Transcript_6137/g.13630  ORF Transcript_6137/g.13630 Transcript_6137/m.13630 type:complete len:257 (-) Transcript_6137:142-912(-)|eukprot:CAMPEP_0178438100 /NCGR_PEP_ID=MMETSP0689_2-20121128/35383_1 /TAXON_ID=160604 /ORGANISM="Amphidinium massartii, Strain CS-259" /LENGTH=256 /DNA_ID=CAMNT_0020060421 /DNA_START=79 /DNA_END=849 /DNA_ORIENTATION=+